MSAQNLRPLGVLRLALHGRLNKGIFKSFVKGEKIKIKNNNDYIIAKIKKIRKYSSFEEYLTQEGLRRTLP